MRIVIAGAGEVGSFLTELLSKDRQDIVVIDINKEKLDFLANNFDVLTVEGSATSIKTLEEAKVKGAFIFIAATFDEHVNIVAASLAKKVGARRTIIRVQNLEYTLPANKRYFKNIGVDTVICPDKLAVNEIAALIRQSATSEVFEFSKGDLSLFVTRLKSNSELIGKKLVEATKLTPDFQYRTLLIVRDDKTFIPRKDDVFKENDIVYVVSDKKGLSKLMKISAQSKVDIGDVIILGGTKIGVLTALKLEKHFNVKLFEANHKRCEDLSGILKNTLVINSDGRDADILKQENIETTDAFIAVTDSSETNIFTSLLAKKMGAKKTVTEVENIDFIHLSKDLNIEGIVNKKLIAASLTTRFLINADVLSVKFLNSANADIIEVIAKQNSKITQGKVKDVNFPKEATIGGVIRGNQSFIVAGDFQVLPGDIVILLVLPTAIHTIEKFFN